MSSIKKEDINGFEQCFNMIEEGVDSMAASLASPKDFNEVYASINAFLYFIHQVKLVMVQDKRQHEAASIVLPFTLKEVSK